MRFLQILKFSLPLSPSQKDENKINVQYHSFHTQNDPNYPIDWDPTELEQLLDEHDQEEDRNRVIIFS